MYLRRLPLLAALSCSLTATASLAAQIGGTGTDGALVVTQGTATLDTTSRTLGFDFTSITVAAGAELRFVGSQPARLRSQGPITIDGWLNVDGFRATSPQGAAGGAGGFAGGRGGLGWATAGAGPGGGCAGVSNGTVYFPPGPASHATLARAPSWCGGTSAPPSYGSPWPFSLLGGSGGGGTANPFSGGFEGLGGSGGGGSVLLAADGPIVIRGRISAKPGTGMAPGSSGSILIQTTSTLRIEGIVDASETPGTAPLTVGGEGFVRLDTYGDPGSIAGTVTPLPMQVVMPQCRDAGAPQVGSTWQIHVDAWPQDVVAVWLAGRNTNLPFPPLGVLRLDPSAGLTSIGAHAAALNPPWLDATATIPVSVPGNASLRGVTVHVQALNAITRAASPRFSALMTRKIQ